MNCRSTCIVDTNIGTDDRSQFDLFEAMPGGLAGVRRAVDELHAAGVKVTCRLGNE